MQKLSKSFVLHLWPFHTKVVNPGLLLTFIFVVCCWVSRLVIHKVSLAQQLGVSIAKIKIKQSTPHFTIKGKSL